MNPILAHIEPSVIRAINARKLPGDIDLGLGEPTLPPPLWAFAEAMTWVQAHGCPYSANAGENSLRAAIARRYDHPGLNQSENVCITVGSQEALFLTVKTLCAPGVDEVLIIEPAYPAYAKICQMENIAVQRVCLDPSTDFIPEPKQVLAAVTPETKLIILASPANPTGRIWTNAMLETLANGLNELGSRRPYVLVDEVYRELCYVNPRPRSLAEWYDRTLIAGSLSKSHALTGLRLGWLLAPREVQTSAIKAHQFMVTAASTFSQRVAEAIFTSDAPLDVACGHYQERRTALLEHLQRLKLAHIAPEGAFYALLAIPARLGKNSLQTATELLDQQRVVTIPGSAFGAENWLRISWVAPPDEIAIGLERIQAYFQHPVNQSPTGHPNKT